VSELLLLLLFLTTHRWILNSFLYRAIFMKSKSPNTIRFEWRSCYIPKCLHTTGPLSSPSWLSCRASSYPFTLMSTVSDGFFRPSSGAQNCTYSVRPILRYWSDKYLTLYVQFWAPDDGRKTLLKHVERLTEINKLLNIASCWLYSVNLLAMYGPTNVKYIFYTLFWQRV